MRDELNERAPRRIAVLDPIKLVIDNYPGGQRRGLSCAEPSAAAGAGQARAAAHARALDRARRFQERRPRATSAFAGRRGASALRLRHRCIGADKDASGSGQRRALHLRSGHPQRHARRRRRQGQGQHPLAVGARTPSARRCACYDRLFAVPQPGRARDLGADAPPPRAAADASNDEEIHFDEPTERNYLDDLNPEAEACCASLCRGRARQRAE